MDVKQVPLIGQVKDAQVVLAACPDKRVKLTILVADIPASYGMLLSRTLCKELGGEIKMEWSEAIIPLGKQKIKLEPESKNKYTVFPSDNPKAQILFQECQFGNYLILAPDKKNLKKQLMNMTDCGRWNLMEVAPTLALEKGQFCCPLMVIFFLFSFKLDFKNTNNTAEYETLLLGLNEAKCKGIKFLKVKGDVELIVRQVRNVY